MKQNQYNFTGLYLNAFSHIFLISFLGWFALGAYAVLCWYLGMEIRAILGNHHPVPNPPIAIPFMIALTPMFLTIGAPLLFGFDGIIVCIVTIFFVFKFIIKEDYRPRNMVYLLCWTGIVTGLIFLNLLSIFNLILYFAIAIGLPIAVHILISYYVRKRGEALDAEVDEMVRQKTIEKTKKLREKA